MARLLLGLCVSVALFAACATEPNRFDPHGPGEPCIDTCPDGMACTGMTYSKLPRRTNPGRCELEPGRCATDADCRRSARCVRTSERIGLCAEAPQL
jgi:hypothetical protein